MDFGLPIRLESPTGAIVFNGFAFSGADPAAGFSGDGFPGESYFRLSDVSGIDMPALRTTQDDRPQRDGAILYDSFLGARYPVLRGTIVPAAGTEAQMVRSRQEMQEQLARVILGLLRADGTLRWAPYGVISGTPDEAEKDRVLTVRAWEPLQVSGGVRKDFHIGLVSPDPYAICAEADTYTDSADPLLVTVTHHGTAPARPLLRLTGAATPVTAVEFRNSNGAKLLLSGISLDEDAYVEVDLARETVTIYNNALGAVQPSNPGFETNTTGWTIGSGTITRDTVVFDEGVASGRFALNADNGYASLQTLVSGLTPGLYRLTMRLRRAASQSDDVRVTVHGSEGTFQTFAQGIPTGSFATYTVDFWSGSAVTIVVELGLGAATLATNHLWIDAVKILDLSPQNGSGKVDPAVSEFWHLPAALSPESPSETLVSAENFTGGASNAHTFEVVHHHTWLA